MASEDLSQGDLYTDDMITWPGLEDWLNAYLNGNLDYPDTYNEEPAASLPQFALHTSDGDLSIHLPATMQSGGMEDNHRESGVEFTVSVNNDRRAERLQRKREKERRREQKREQRREERRQMRRNQRRERLEEPTNLDDEGTEAGNTRLVITTEGERDVQNSREERKREQNPDSFLHGSDVKLPTETGDDLWRLMGSVMGEEDTEGDSEVQQHVDPETASEITRLSLTGESHTSSHSLDQSRLSGGYGRNEDLADDSSDSIFGCKYILLA